ncbi:MAG: hypothetical protein CMG91_08610 [Marinobacter sp.]|nr:hypothetical protein [Marinobacter sp.]
MQGGGEVTLRECRRPWMADAKRTWVWQSDDEAELHAIATRQQSEIAGRTRLRVLVAVLGE